MEISKLVKMTQYDGRNQRAKVFISSLCLTYDNKLL